MVDPLGRVRETTAWVVANARHVSIGDEGVIDAAAEELFRDAPESVKWDEEGWHYQADASEGGPRTAQYVLVLECVRCLWFSMDLSSRWHCRVFSHSMSAAARSTFVSGRVQRGWSTSMSQAD